MTPRRLSLLPFANGSWDTACMIRRNPPVAVANATNAPHSGARRRIALCDDLPLAIFNKKKVVLEMPYGQWFRAELKDLLTSCCGRERLEKTGLFEPAAVQALIEDHLERRRDNGRALWGLMNYMMWYELYIRA